MIDFLQGKNRVSGDSVPQSFVAYVLDASGKSVDVEEITKGGVEQAIAVE